MHGLDPRLLQTVRHHTHAPLSEEKVGCTRGGARWKAAYRRDPGTAVGARGWIAPVHAGAFATPAGTAVVREGDDFLLLEAGCPARFPNSGGGSCLMPYMLKPCSSMRLGASSISSSYFRSISSACSTGAHCIGVGMEQIQLGKADVAFCARAARAPRVPLSVSGVTGRRDVPRVSDFLTRYN